MSCDYVNYSLKLLYLTEDSGKAGIFTSILQAADIRSEIIIRSTSDGLTMAPATERIDLVLIEYSPGTPMPLASNDSKDGMPPLIIVCSPSDEEEALGKLSHEHRFTDLVVSGPLLPMRLVNAVRKVMASASDRWERTELQDQFIQAQKMEVVGQLAGGVAHDFNNILAVIMGYSGLLTSGLAENGQLRPYAEEIGRASERAAGLTRQLLVFSRKQTVSSVVLDLNLVVADLEVMLRRLIDENIELTLEPRAQLGRVSADAGYVGQVLMNLAVNARDAMPNGGKLIITTDNLHLDRPAKVATGNLEPGDYVLLSVRDTGAGMTNEVKERLFEAFFTTKPEGRGTGLGLASCRTIVQLCGGHIDFSSEPGKGSAFKVFFPQVESPIELKTKAIEGPLPRGTETLLVVEDDKSVRHLAKGLLKAQGYKVLSAANGQEGLNVALEHTGSQLRLVVTDVIMPLMNGKVMAEWLKASFPDLKVLFTSGYTDDAIAQLGVLKPGVAFLAKPYSPGVLAHKVREMLDIDGHIPAVAGKTTAATGGLV